jgi:hypothetical protein
MTGHGAMRRRANLSRQHIFERAFAGLGTEEDDRGEAKTTGGCKHRIDADQFLPFAFFIS